MWSARTENQCGSQKILPPNTDITLMLTSVQVILTSVQVCVSNIHYGKFMMFFTFYHYYTCNIIRDNRLFLLVHEYTHVQTSTTLYVHEVQQFQPSFWVYTALLQVHILS